MLKRFLSLALAVLMTLLLCSCDFRSLFGGEQTSSDNVKDDPIVGDGSSYSEFINVMKEIKTRGDKTSEMELPVNSEYYYSFAGACCSQKSHLQHGRIPKNVRYRW